MSSFRRRALLLLAPLFLFATGILLFPSSGRDDAHIGYWVALCLARFGRVMNYNGDAVEQSSTLLHALVLAAAYRVTHIDMVVLGRLSAIVFGVGAVLMTQRVAARIDRALAIPAGLLVASSAYFIYWSFGGMEGTLCALLALCLILLFGDYVASPNERLLTPALIPVTLVILAFLLVRPEQPLVLGFVLVGAFVVRRDQWRRLLVLAGIAAVAAIAIFVWRWQTFHSLFPQPVSAKSGALPLHTAKVGFRYFSRHVLVRPSIAFLFFVAAVGAIQSARVILRHGRTPSHLVFALLYLCSYGAFVILAGGDWMEAGRFFVPLLPVVAIFAAIAWRNAPRFSGAVALLLLAAQLCGIAQVARRVSTAVPLWSEVTTEPYMSESHRADFSWFERANRPNLRDIPTIRRLDALVRQLRTARGDAEPVRMMSAQLGMVAYYVVGAHFGHVQLLDRRGLIDRRFSSCSLLSRLRRTAGGLQLDYDYYFAHRDELERECHVPRPDIIFDIGEPRLLPDYTVVYTQSGAIRTDSKWLPGSNFRASQFIAVRSDFLPLLEREQ